MTGGVLIPMLAATVMPTVVLALSGPPENRPAARTPPGLMVLIGAAPAPKLLM